MGSENKKQIAKNTAALYFRMLLTMVVGLYTSRIVLSTLGVVDYGIYNIVGGIVILFSFFNNAMFSAIQRFLNVEIAKNDHFQLNKIFSVSMTVQISIAITVFVLSETIGLWFVNTQLNLPTERMIAVNWVYQFSIMTFLINIFLAPYEATILANEHMSFFAYASIIDVSTKLLIVFLLQYIGHDSLIVYAALTASLSFLFLAIYRIYCTKKFDYCYFHYSRDKILYRQLMSFSGWSLLGGIANVGKSQGVNIILNIFCGVVVNAAVGIANQVSTALNNFVFNFQLAFNPQIVKSYATNERDYFMQLIFQTAKLSYFLLFFISLPVLLNTEIILDIWLKDVPDYTVMFCQLSIIVILIDTISGPLWISIQAVGIIKKYQIVISTVLIMNVPLSYLSLMLGFPPYSVLWINLIVGIVALIVRLRFLRKLVDLSIKKFFKDVLFKIAFVTLISLPLPLVIKYFTTGYFGAGISLIISITSVGLAVFFVGLKSNERELLRTTLFKFLKKMWFPK